MTIVAKMIVQAQLSGTIDVCMGTVGPGSTHLLNGLCDAKKSHAPVLAIFGQVPACFTRTITSAAHATGMVESALQAALATPEVAVLTLPGDVADLDLPPDAHPPRVAVTHPPTVPDQATLARAATLIDEARTVTMLVGIGAVDARYAWGADR